MVEYLKTKKGYFYKFKKIVKKKISQEEYKKIVKKKISQEEYKKIKQKKNKTKKNKTKKIKKLIGGTGEPIKEITENYNETEFEQKHAVINYGYGEISTYNLVNCIAIGGVFELSKTHGTFLTHESPTDYLEQQQKLIQIKRILDEKTAIIGNIVIFCIDKPARDVYKNGLTTIQIIDLMYKFCQDLFLLTPVIINYSCDISTMRCGKAIISPTGPNAALTPLRKPPRSETRKLAAEPKETFIVEVLYDKDNDKIYKCPICKVITGTLAPKKPTDTSLFAHIDDCPNKNKIPIEN
jgi:hypothetical protein